MNESCIIPTSPFLLNLSHVLVCLTAPVYITTCYILIFKCPPFFNQYRSVLLRHIFTCIFMEYFVDIIWQMTVVVPYSALCSVGIGNSYPVFMFSIVVAGLCATGISIMHMFQYRMNAVTDDSIRILKSIITGVKFYHYFMMTSCLCLLIASYNHLADQKAFKTNVQYKFGSVPSYIWCDNCMFINTDSTTVLIFVGLGASSQPLAAVYFGLSVYASKLGLQKLRKSLSQRTITIQRNFLNSLYLQTAVHVIFISVPLGIFFLTFVLHIPSSAMYMSYILMAMFTQHGSLSTLALLMSNKPLYSEFTKTFLRMKTNIRGSDRVSYIRGAEREHSSWKKTARRSKIAYVTHVSGDIAGNWEKFSTSNKRTSAKPHWGEETMEGHLAGVRTSHGFRAPLCFVWKVGGACAKF
ncbi:hypothetical protein B9Z55_019156 [Caenorhabditis nigoni]|uniref:Uncharacterized protein n=1 Tax=Caenorhabditis nigoni TaxID=1611254 RepID=A0A2G5TH94_9PELO|nr:hypothetical protein B9Z55_019156 [Caenorhabditis nigoni]